MFTPFCFCTFDAYQTLLICHLNNFILCEFYIFPSLFNYVPAVTVACLIHLTIDQCYLIVARPIQDSMTVHSGLAVLYGPCVDYSNN